MLQIFIKHTLCGSSLCYLKGFGFKGRVETDIHGGKGESPWNDYSGKIWTRDDNSEQSLHEKPFWEFWVASQPSTRRRTIPIVFFLLPLSGTKYRYRKRNQPC
jgi:hypothetical protein